jgi:hypothetical protein
MSPTLTKFKFSLDFGRCNNSSMCLNISDAERQLDYLENVDQGIRELQYDIYLPNKINLHLSGKNHKTDTKIDSKGNIIADKYIKLISMSLGGIPINSANLFKNCRYTVDNKIDFNTYWGFNGLVEIEFKENNFLKWHLKSNNLFDI